MDELGPRTAVQLVSASFECLRCQSKLTLKGRHAQNLAESGTCPICHVQGMVTMSSFRI